MSRSVAIFGSCVTRDAFELQARLAPGPDTVALYLSRTTINASLAAPVTALGSPPPASVVKFEERCVLSDLEKTHYQELRRKRFEVLVIDLIDERHFLAAVGDGEAAYSVPFMRLCETRGIDHKRFPLTPPSDPAVIARTLTNIPAFLAKLAEIVDTRRVILHEARWAQQYLAKDGSIRPFAQGATVDAFNALLDRYYAAMKAACPEMRAIRVPDADTLGDEGHRWTLEPFHYAETYYRAFLHQYEQIAAEIVPARTSVA